MKYSQPDATKATTAMGKMRLKKLPMIAAPYGRSLVIITERRLITPLGA
jgi:hypothetical protein